MLVNDRHKGLPSDLQNRSVPIGRAPIVADLDGARRCGWHATASQKPLPKFYFVGFLSSAKTFSASNGI